jgi:hypothetical protein
MCTAPIATTITTTRTMTMSTGHIAITAMIRFAIR